MSDIFDLKNIFDSVCKHFAINPVIKMFEKRSFNITKGKYISC